VGQAEETLPTTLAMAEPASISPQSILTNAPPEARGFTPALRDVLKVYDAWVQTQRRVKQLRGERDGVKTGLVAMTGELDVVTQEQQQLEQHLQALQRERQERLAAIRKDLEAELQDQLAQARQQMTKELEQEFAQRIEAFAIRQRELIDRNLEQSIQLQENEVQQLTQEIQEQTSTLLDRLGRLEADSDIEQSLAASTQRAIARRKSELEARRQQLEAQRGDLVEARRGEFAAALKEQQSAELQSRLVLKEAGLRQSMAALLHKAYTQDATLVEQAEEKLQHVRDRRAQLTARQAELTTQLQTLDQELASTTKRAESLDAERQVELAALNQAFQKTNPGVGADALSWFGRIIQQLPAELATELGLIQQRVREQALLQRQLEEQRRVLRERQLALQLSREMERRYLEAQQKQQRDEETKARKAQELLDRAKELAARGQFDQALTLVTQAQAINPPQASVVALVQDEIAAAQQKAARQAQIAQVERLFSSAMEAFNKGRYEDAIRLFEQVIAKEAELNVTPQEERVLSTLVR